MEVIKAILSKEEINEIAARLNQYHQDRLCNDEEEVTIIFFPKRDRVR